MYAFRMKRLGFLRPILVFLGAAAFCAAFIPWNGFGDPDGFYHAKMAMLIWQHGPLKAFPWLDLTVFGKNFADLHFLFHAILAPFTAAFGMFNGARIGCVVLSGLFFAVFEVCLRRLKLRYSLVWTAILLTTAPFIFRILLAKATPLALLLFIAGLTAAWLRKPWLVFVFAGVFALSHSGWIYLAGSIALMACGQLAYFKTVDDLSWRKSFDGSMWRETAAGYLGGLAGMLVHPNFPDIFRLTWIQVFTIGLGTPFQHVVMGLEWQPADVKSLFTSYAAWIILGLLGLAGMFLAPRKPLDRDKAQLTVSVGWILAVLFALTLKSRRNTEYLAPIVALWCASLWSLVDPKKLFADAKDSFKAYGQTAFLVLAWVMIILSVAYVAKETLVGWYGLRDGIIKDTAFRDSMSAISKQAKPGDRVFHSSWDEFPMLFAADDRLRYIAGLDPTFLYVASSTLSDDVKNLTWGLTSSTKEQAWELIHDRLDSKFVFVGKSKHEQFMKLIMSDPRYIQIASSTESAAFRVENN